MTDNKTLHSGKDKLSCEARSLNMSKIRSKDTAPEVLLRRMLHRAGYRFRKNVSAMPGVPDIVMPKFKTVIFVHGCFWHRHDCKKGQSVPANRRAFWEQKFRRNIERDKEVRDQLIADGWNVLVIWECMIKGAHSLSSVEGILSVAGS